MVAAALALTACAGPPEDPEARAAFEEANDPLEDFNRYIHEVNYAFDQLVFRPLSGMYRTGVPRPMRDALRNFFDNLRAPVIFVNDLLQGEGERAGITLGRFLTNSTLGLAGFIDTADMLFDLEKHDEDFGQTLAVWGAGEGFYLVLPLFGPSNPRDAFGLAVDSFLDPWNTLLRAGGVDFGPPARTVLNALDLRSRNIDTLDEIERTSIDFYAALRSLYRQRRADQVRNGLPSAIQPVPAIRGTDEGRLPVPTTPQAPQVSGSERLPYAASPILDDPMPGEAGPPTAPAISAQQAQSFIVPESDLPWR
jgi:phospholipid-binding lipoprotein MlaA